MPAARLAFLLLALLLYPLSVPGESHTSNAWRTYAPDPGGYHMGFSRAHWIPTMSRVLFWGGNSHNYKGNNSVRLFNPVTNKWEIVWPSGWDNGGLQNRDNQRSFFVPARGRLGEFWVIDGAFSTAPNSPPGDHFGGRFDLAARKWFVARSSEEFARGLIKGFKKTQSRSAHDWCPDLNTGVLFGGATEGNATKETAFIEPNPDGPEPYRMWTGVLQGSPPPRAAVQNHGVCVGSAFYAYGGTAQETQGSRLVSVNRNDLWRLDVPTRTWSQLASGGPGGGQLVVTYDSRNHVLIVHGGYKRDDVFAYHIDGDRWEDMTPTMKRAGNQPWRRYNHVGAYAPTVNQHIYTGGNTFKADGTPAPYTEASLPVSGYTYSDAKRAAAPQPVAVAVAGPAIAQAERGPSAAIDLPLKTWVARPLPPYGKGPCPTGCKHIRLAHNPDDGRIYFLGGDYGGPGAVASGRNELYSYSIAGGDWRLDYPYCGPGGELQPSHPDEVGWVFDTNRRLFWMLPGFLYGTAHTNKCPASAARQVVSVLTFDPAKKRWAYVTPADPGASASYGKFAQYDPKTDQIITFRWDGGRGSVAVIYDIRKATRRMVGLARDTRGVSVNNARLTDEYTAMDPERRTIYVISPLEGRLLRYDIDAETITYLTDTPAKAARNTTILAWDSVNKLLLWPQLPRGLDGYVKLHVYHPDRNAWEDTVVTTRPEGLTVRGNSAVFDPTQNALLIMGGLRGGDVDPSLTHFFLYRYGNGTAGRAETPPSTPRGTRG